MYTPDLEEPAIKQINNFNNPRALHKMYDFVQLISAEEGMHSNDFLTEKKHIPSIFLISLTKSGLFAHNKSWSSTYVGYFWTAVESSSQINIIILGKERFGKKMLHTGDSPSAGHFSLWKCGLKTSALLSGAI